MGERTLTSHVVVGREEPLRALDDALAAAAEGRPSLTLISGEAGVGKTRLVQEVEARAEEFLVLHGESVEFGSEELAYAPVAAALRDWLDGQPLDARRYEALLELLGRLADERGPLLLVLEDIHWAGRSTGELLAFLARNLRGERLALLATFRADDELPAHLRRLAAELARRPTVRRLELEPLAPAEVAAQLEAIAGGPVPAALARELHARAGGNPFFVEELFAARDAATLKDAVLLRVDRLGPEAVRMLALVAAAGRLEDDLLEALAPDPAALHAALDAGVLVRGEDGVAFRHGLIGEVVYDRLLPGERRELHRAIAAALPPAPAGRRARQFHRAGLRAEALAASVDAGLEAAGVFAFGEAWVHFERALELWDPAVPLPVDRVELLAQAARAARFAGDPDRAVALCREALDLLDHAAEPERAARLYERLGEIQFWDDEAALECYAAALALTPGEPRLLAAEGHALMGLRRWREARERCEAALDAGAGPRITLGLVLAFLGEAEAGEAHLQDALALCETPEDTARAYVFLGEVRRVRGDHAGALAAWTAGEEVAERFGLDSHVGFLHVAAADDLLALGRWDEAARRLAEAARMELGRTAAPLRRAVAGMLHALRGDLDAARRELEESVSDGLPSEIVVPLAAARATLALAEGELEAAQVHLDGALAAVPDPVYMPPVHSLALRVEAELAERARARRRPVDARRAHALLQGLDTLVTDAPDARAHRALAFAELARVRDEPAAERWQAAAAAWDDLAAPYPAAYARLQGAEAALREGGARRAAADLLVEAHATTVALGARPLREAIEALARRARLALSPAAPPAREEDPSGLTTRESEVLRLLAEGLTNREIAERLFITQKTVSAHLAHIFGKLDVHTRTEAAGRARALGVL